MSTTRSLILSSSQPENSTIARVTLTTSFLYRVCSSLNWVFVVLLLFFTIYTPLNIGKLPVVV